MTHEKLVARAKKYGISVDALKEMLAGGTCRICGAQPRKGLVVDHCHRTNVVRGAVCYGCNTMIGHIEKAQRMNLFDRILDHLEQAPVERAKYDGAFERAKERRALLKDSGQLSRNLYYELVRYEIEKNSHKLQTLCVELGFCPIRYDYEHASATGMSGKMQDMFDTWLKKWWYVRCKDLGKLFMWAKPHAGGAWELHFDTMELKHEWGDTTTYYNLDGKGLLEVYEFAESFRGDRKRRFKDWHKYNAKTNQFVKDKESWSVGALGDLHTVELPQIVEALRLCSKVPRGLSLSEKDGSDAA